MFDVKFLALDGNGINRQAGEGSKCGDGVTLHFGNGKKLLLNGNGLALEGVQPGNTQCGSGAEVDGNDLTIVHNQFLI